MYDDNSGVPLCNSEIVEEHLVLRQRLLQTLSSIFRLGKRQLKNYPKQLAQFVDRSHTMLTIAS